MDFQPLYRVSGERQLAVSGNALNQTANRAGPRSIRKASTSTDIKFVYFFLVHSLFVLLNALPW